MPSRGFGGWGVAGISVAARQRRRWAILAPLSPSALGRCCDVEPHAKMAHINNMNSRFSKVAYKTLQHTDGPTNSHHSAVAIYGIALMVLV